MGLFPEEQKQGDIKFYFAKSLAYKTRLAIIFCLLISGIVIQLFVNFWFGFIVLAAGTAISLVKGYSLMPELGHKEEWQRVTPDEYTKVREKQAQIREWDSDLLDITNLWGVITLVSLIVFCAVLWRVFFLYSEDAGGSQKLLQYWAADCVIIFFPHWVTGVRTYLKRDKLIINIKILEDVMRLLSAPSDVQVIPMLATVEAKKGGRVPSDARLLVRFLNAPESFLGMQVQISTNTVQGTDYPYLYCVLLAKQEAALFYGQRQRFIIGIERKGLVLEEQKSGDVDVLVVRQKTTYTSGYHTNARQRKYVVESSLQLARDLLRPQDLPEASGSDI